MITPRSHTHTPATSEPWVGASCAVTELLCHIWVMTLLSLKMLEIKQPKLLDRYIITDIHRYLYFLIKTGSLSHPLLFRMHLRRSIDDFYIFASLWAQTSHANTVRRSTQTYDVIRHSSYVALFQRNAWSRWRQEQLLANSWASAFIILTVFILLEVRMAGA